MEAWKKVFREGFAPLLSTTGLTALARALKDDDPRLLQGATCTPPPLQTVRDWPVETVDAIAFCGVVDHGGFAPRPEGFDLSREALLHCGACTVAQAEEFFARACFECDEKLGKPVACRWFLNWFDETPRSEMRKCLLAEVNRVLACRRLGVVEWIGDMELHDYAEEHMDVWARNEMEALDAATAEG